MSRGSPRGADDVGRPKAQQRKGEGEKEEVGGRQLAELPAMGRPAPPKAVEWLNNLRTQRAVLDLHIECITHPRVSAEGLAWCVPDPSCTGWLPPPKPMAHGSWTLCPTAQARGDFDLPPRSQPFHPRGGKNSLHWQGLHAGLASQH
jgi:hypothetical protein